MTSETYLIKLKRMGWTDAQIALKLGISVAEVQEQWRQITDVSEAVLNNGYVDMHQQFQTLAQQHHLVGASLRAIGNGISQICTAQELEEMVKPLVGVDKASELVHLLLKNCIILKPYIPVAANDAINELEAEPCTTKSDGVPLLSHQS